MRERVKPLRKGGEKERGRERMERKCVSVCVCVCVCARMCLWGLGEKGKQ